MWPLRILFVLATVLLGACAAQEADSGGTGAITTDVFGDLRARQPRSDVTGSVQGVVRVDRTTGASYNFGPAGSPDFGPAGSAAAGAESGGSDGGYRINFENAELRDVVRAVLGDALGVPYTMSPDVAGIITVSSPRPVSRDELLQTLESALQTQGFSLSKTGSGYTVAAGTIGAGVVDRAGRTTPGYGITVVPLRYVSVRTMSRLLSGFIVDAEGVRVDTVQNAVVIRGPGPKREEVAQAVLSFDADWMRDQSVSIFEVRRASPQAIVSELEDVFSGSNGVIQFKPITRLRAVMAISKNATLIRRAEDWVRRLDQQSEAAGENVFVYRAHYRDARELARILSGIFGAGGGDAGGAAAAEQPAARTPASTGGDGADDGSGFADVDADLGGDGANRDPFGNSGGGGDFGGDQDPSGAGGTAMAAAGGLAPATIDLTGGNQGQGPAIRITADASNNSVITYTDGETWRKVLAALRQLDSTPLQVAINVTIAEVRLNEELRNGVQYFVKSSNVGLGDDNGSIGLFSRAANTLQRELPGFNFVVGTNSNPDVIISALDQITDVQVLSSPSLVVLENQPATLQVGDSIPVTVRQAQDISDSDAPIVNQVEFRNTGIILKVTPRIGTNDAVTMQVEQEISNVSDGANTLTPTISKRAVSSTISVISGQTVLLAGLISQGRDRGQSGIPGLNRLKGIGNLFGERARASSRNELVILIRPVVVRNGEDAQSVAEEFRSRLWSVNGSGGNQ